ncbi:MAG: formate-dependent phosphoribosylglycinamide formyltransferase [Gemmatimonadales bacterium]|nr:MAG: formate-dependent phosphoribosylglycinamide formyltransferase [Gemmatimonadales bacterium]
MDTLLPKPSLPTTILLLGAGELGRELAIAAHNLGIRVAAVDRYERAPAMQVAHESEVLSLLDGDALRRVVERFGPSYIIPEMEAIRTETLEELESEGIPVAPSAEATTLTLNREAIRRVVAEEMGIRTPAFAVAESAEALRRVCDETVGYPCMVKSLWTSSGRGQSLVTGPARLQQAWAFAAEETRPGMTQRVLAEEYIDFRSEITLLAVRERDGRITFLKPIGHRQELGAYRESWMPAAVEPAELEEAEGVSRRILHRLPGPGIFGFEFYLTGTEVIFSELSARPHDTGLVTLCSQDLSQFELHLRALLGLPIPDLRYRIPAASAVILARGDGEVVRYEGVDRAFQVETAQVRLFGKPNGYPMRRMGVALANGTTVAEARARALEAAGRVDVRLS